MSSICAPCEYGKHHRCRGEGAYAWMSCACSKAHHSVAIGAIAEALFGWIGEAA